MSKKEDFMKKSLEEVLKLLTKDIEEAKVKNEEVRWLQNHIIEKIAVRVMLEYKLPSLDWIEEGIRHYVNLGREISTNNILTRLVEESTKLLGMKDPAERQKKIQEKNKNEEKAIALVKRRIAERFSTQ